MSADGTIRDYYESLRRGEPLYPYFLESPDTVKIGIGERLIGYDAVAEGLREQSRTTDDWTVGSTDLRTTEDGDTAWFADAVRMQWRDTVEDRWLDYETRWTGTLVRRDEEWLVASMHVSAAVDGEKNVVPVDDDGSVADVDDAGGVDIVDAVDDESAADASDDETVDSNADDASDETRPGGAN